MPNTSLKRSVIASLIDQKLQLSNKQDKSRIIGEFNTKVDDHFIGEITHIAKVNYIYGVFNQGLQSINTMKRLDYYMLDEDRPTLDTFYHYEDGVLTILEPCPQDLEMIKTYAQNNSPSLPTGD